MSISTLKFVAITSKAVPGAVDIELYLTEGSTNYEQVISSNENGVKETLITLPEPVPEGNLTLDDFRLYVSSMDSGNSALLLKSIYIFEVQNNVVGKLLLAIPNWPQTLWFKQTFGPVSGGIGTPKLNLGDVANTLK